MSRIVHVIVKAHPKRPTAIISVAENGDMVVSIGTLPIMGRANKMLVILLAKYFEVSPSKVNLIKGFQGNYKTIQVFD